MKFNIIILLFFYVLGSVQVYAADYVYRDLMANSLPTTKCKTRLEAKTDASTPYILEKYSKLFCQSQGYGWHVEQIKDNGEIACNECTNKTTSKFQCFRKDIIVACKRLKPGSVGLLPGQGQD